MPRYIDVDRLKKFAYTMHEPGDDWLVVEWEDIERAPTIDTAENDKFGKWIYERYGGMWPAGVPRPNNKCSECKQWSNSISRYCPNCGIQMIEGDE